MLQEATQTADACVCPAGMRLFWIPRKEHTWIEAPAADREKIEASGKAEFTTVLSLDNTAADPSHWLYQGPFYIDLDGEIEETISQTQAFLKHLESLGLDLEQIKVFASGKKGFHIEVPQGCFLPDPKPLQYLPAIYKEMAFAVYHDTLDLAVYTAKKGRMWRCPNFKRPETGTFKVQITIDEVFHMSPSTYAELVSQPRPLWQPEPPTLCPRLAAIFTAARDKVATAAKRKPHQDKSAAALKQRCQKSGYPLPPSLLMVATGKTPARDGLGFNQIALQMAIAARDIGINANDLVMLCRGLIANHEGDSSRYGSPFLREKELRKQYAYVTENAAYSFNVGAVRAVLPAGARCADLRGL